MPNSRSGFDPELPVTVAVSFRVLAPHEAVLEKWQLTFTAAMDRLIELMGHCFPDVEIVEDVELPPTEVISRDEV